MTFCVVSHVILKTWSFEQLARNFTILWNDKYYRVTHDTCKFSLCPKICRKRFKSQTGPVWDLNLFLHIFGLRQNFQVSSVVGHPVVFIIPKYCKISGKLFKTSSLQNHMRNYTKCHSLFLQRLRWIISGQFYKFCLIEKAKIRSNVSKSLF